MTALIPNANDLGLILSGGGARGAYQVGVLKGILKIQEEIGRKELYKVVSGVSAGSINAAFWAAYADQIFTAIDYLAEIWANIRPEDVFKTDAFTLGRLGIRLIEDLSLGGLKKKLLAKALLDTAPLNNFLKKRLPFENIKNNVSKGFLDYVAITASDYISSISVTFVQGKEPTPNWERSRRRSETVQLNIDHIMSSAAIPLFFPPVKLGERYFGDGSLRNLAPLSPAIHLGANRLLIIGVRKKLSNEEMEKKRPFSPSLGRVLSSLISSIFFDATELDIELLSRINHTLEALPEESRPKISFRPLKFITIFPSEDIGTMAKQYHHNLPKIMRYLISGLGSLEEASDLVSYLLFEPEFCRALIDLGLQDALRAKDKIVEFLTDEEKIVSAD